MGCRAMDELPGTPSGRSNAAFLFNSGRSGRKFSI
jgi:hypothetical protein